MYKSFREMPVWNEAMEIAELVFRLTDSLPKKEDYGLTSQIRRAALSISANIAEAFGRYHLNDKINFYYFARGSIAETQNHLEYGFRVGYFRQEDVKSIALKIGDLYGSVNRLIKSLKPQSKSQSQPNGVKS